MMRTDAAAETIRSRTHSPRPAVLSDVTGAGSFVNGVVPLGAASAGPGVCVSSGTVCITFPDYYQLQPSPPGGHITRTRFGLSMGLGWCLEGTRLGASPAPLPAARFASSRYSGR